ncbi:MAG: FHA domain-containing protein [Armatimonadota bacterium]|nr:FHA domain-containing protein [Armatimonadota bacterium]
MDLTVVLTMGKYVLLAVLYGFVFAVFRGIIGQLLAESRRETGGVRVRRRVARPRAERRRAREVAADAATRPEPEPTAAEDRPVPQPPPAPASEEPMREEPRAPRLVVIESDDEERAAGDEVPLSAAVTVGRSEENSLRLRDRFVSSRHALICLRDGRRILVDRGSTNGTFVNGERVEDEVELRDRDRIAMGNTVFEYRAR